MNIDNKPHIKYLPEKQHKSYSDRILYYLGGETEENHSRLSVGRQYELRTVSYSESPNVDRVSVWICMDEKVKVCVINPKNFGNFTDLRNSKIENVLDGTDLLNHSGNKLNEIVEKK